MVLPPKLISLTDFWSIRDTGFVGLGNNGGIGCETLVGEAVVPGLGGSRMVAPLRHSLTLLWLGSGSPRLLLIRQAAETTAMGMYGSSETSRKSSLSGSKPPVDANLFFPILSTAA